MWSFTKGLSKLAFAFTLFLIYTACTEDTPDLGNIEYALKNNSEINVGFKVRLTVESSASIIRDSAIIKPGEELVIVKSHNSQEPKLIINKIEIWNTEFKSKYKEIQLDNYTKENGRYTLTITMPPINSSEIIKFNTSVHLYLDQTSLFGFYPKVDYPRTTYFFRTPDYFNEIFKTQTPTSTPNADFKMIDYFGSTLIGYNSRVYADKTLLSRVIITEPHGKHFLNLDLILRTMLLLLLILLMKPLAGYLTIKLCLMDSLQTRMPLMYINIVPEISLRYQRLLIIAFMLANSLTITSDMLWQIHPIM
ncbi:MAG: hypothetical protein KF846_05575 [Cyclobacteriaceae bacterium]|nr:hypothetical protein [Cyclobacteriaceae bacterium]